MSTLTQLSKINVFTWLNNILAIRELKKPDQRPLYSYHLTPKEYVELGKILREVSAQEVVSSQPLSACFCLFVAEWFRREYTSVHGWSWEPIWATLGYEVTPPELSKIVPKGLESFWQRPIRSYDISERRNFLGSLFSEGGLPFQVLQEPNSRFQTLFRQLFKQHQAAIDFSSGLSLLTQSLVEKLNLPQAFRVDTSIQLIAEMTESLISLVGTYNLDQKDSPVTILDSVRPTWRELFPLPLDQETGKELLNGLLKQATTEVKTSKQTRGFLSCRHEISEQTFKITTLINLPSSLSFKLEKSTNTNRFDISIYEGQRLIKNLGPSYAKIENGTTITIRPRISAIKTTRKELSDALYIVASIGGQLMHKVPVPNSQLDIADSINGFKYSEDGDNWSWIGHSSFSTKANQVLLLTPKDMLIESNDCTIEKVVNQPEHNSVWLVSGEGRVICKDQDIFTINIGKQAISADSLIELKGRLLDFETRPVHTFCGVPKIISNEQQNSINSVELFFNSKAERDCLISEKYGTQRVSVRASSGEVLLRRRIGILPSDFSIELKSGRSPTEGKVVFHTARNVVYQFVSDEVKASLIKSEKVQNSKQYDLKALSKTPPRSFKVKVYANLESDPIEIILPFPSIGVAVFDKDEKPLKRSFSVNELLGARLHLYAHPAHSIEFMLELSLVGRGNQRLSKIWKHRVNPNNPTEISLYELKNDIESLLALTANIDQQVALRISDYGRTHEYRITRHEANPQFNAIFNTVVFFDVSAVKASSIKPVLMLLSEPERKNIPLLPRLSEGVATGEFELSGQFDKNGPWLVIPAHDSEVRFRPLYLEGSHTAPAASEEIITMQRAVLAFDSHSPANVFDQVLNRMASQPGHSGWQFLKNLFERYNYLPLATFEVWKALVNYPRALAMSFYVFGFNSNYIYQIENDFSLSFESLPVSSLKETDQKYWAWLESQKIPSDLIAENLKPSYGKKLLETLPFLGENFIDWLQHNSYPQEVFLPLPIMQGMIQDEKGWYQILLNNHGDTDKWPEHYGFELKDWCKKQSIDLLGFEPKNNFRNAVVYLPIFLAAVASGRENIEAVFNSGVENKFFIREIRDFDHEWFVSLYRYSLLRFLYISEKELI